MDAHRDRACAQALQGQGVIDLGGVRVIDRKCLHGGQRQLVVNGRGLQRRKASAFGEQVEQEPLPMKIPGRGDGASVLQQIQWRCLTGFAGLDHGFVFRRIFIRSEQDFVQLLSHRGWADPCHQFGRPGLDLRLDLFLFFDGEQGLLHDFSRGFAVTAFAAPAEIMRRFVQPQQCGHLLHRGGAFAEIVFGQIGKTEFFLRGEFVGQFELNALA